MEQSYVVCAKVTFTDGSSTEWASVFPSLEESVVFMNARANPLHAKVQFFLYKLGERVLLTLHDEMIPPTDPPETKTVYAVKS